MECFHVILDRDIGAVYAGMVYMKCGKFIDFLQSYSFSNYFRSMDLIVLLFIYLFIYLFSDRAICGNIN